MNKKYHRVLSTLSLVSLLFNLFFPTLDAVRISIQAQAEETIAEVVSPTPVITPEVVDQQITEPTVAPTVLTTAEVTVAPTETVAPTTEPTATVTQTQTTTPPNSQTETATTPTQTQEQSQTKHNSNEPPAPTQEATATPIPPTATPQLDEQITTTIVKLDGSYADPTLVPETWTDKADYLPTEKVLVSGKNFLPNAQYVIAISSTDPPAVTHNGTFTTTNDGTFTYEYQLDGTYRPNYKVEVKDQSGTVVASTTFTDSPSSTTTANNVSCMAENPKSPNNLNCTANDISLASVTNIVINDDGCKFPGDTVNFTANWKVRANASSRYNAGIWFATAGQVSAKTGPANSCSVTSLPSSPAPFFDGGTQCGGINSGSDGTVSITMTATCNPDVNGLLKLPYCTSWQENNNSSCTSPTDAVPGTPAKCNCQDGFTVAIDVPKSSIEVIKALTPSDDSGRFNLQVDGTTVSGAENIGNSGTTGKVGVNAGTRTIGETAGTNTSLANYSSSVSCNLRGTQTAIATTGTNPWQLNVSAGQDIVCTITNTRINNGSITIVKDAVPNNAQDFAFTTSGTGLSNFSLDDDADGTLSNTRTFSNLAAGTYSVVETAVTGWEQTSAVCSDGSPANAINLSAGENVTCTFTNTKQPKLTVVKVVTNNNGGTKVVADFPLFVDGNAVTSGVANTYTIGQHTVSETTDQNYTATFSGACDANGVVTLAAGDDVTCTITNDDKPATLIVKKIVVNDNGGTQTAENFTFSVNGGTATAFEVDGQNDLTVNAGTYNVTEPAVSGYTTTYEDCSNINLAVGETATCTITNNDQPATLTVTKVLNNQYGGTLKCEDFSFKVNGGLSVPFEADCSNTVSVNAGTHSVVEDAKTGYTPSYNNCTNIVLTNGGSATCTITNDDQPGTLIVKKIVVNDNGGTKIASDFTFKVNGGANTTFTNYVTPPNGEVTLTVNNGMYTVVENADSQYTTTYDNCADVVIPNGGTATCTITNDDKQATLILSKTVVNNNGGTLSANDFAVQVDGIASSWGSHTVNAGTYSVSETPVATYSAGNWGTDCTVNGSVTLLPGETKTCSITNDDIRPQLHLRKVVVNDNGGTVLATAWTLNADGPTSLSGTTPLDSDNSFDAGTYTLSESGGPNGYTASNWVCTGGGVQNENSITLGLGDNVTCTITNDDNTARLTVIKNVVNNNGGDYEADDFTMGVTGTNVSDTEFPGNESGTTITLNAGSYSVGESGPSGYAASYSNNCSGTIALGESKTCTITNNDIAPSLTLIKVVDNNHGGTATATDWTLTADGPTTLSGAGGATSGSTFSAGTYTLSETGGPTTYTSGSWNCTDNVSVSDTNQIELGLGKTTTCTIYNADQPATLIVTKEVVNSYGGTLTASDFTLSATGTNAAPTSFVGSETGTEITLDAGSYSVTEPTLPDGYKELSNTCSGTIAAGETKTCTVTNADTFGKVVVTKFNDVDGDGQQGEGEDGLENWEITLTDFKNQETDKDGVTEFSPVLPGSYVLGEVQQTGWKLTGISCDVTTTTPTPTPTTNPQITPSPTQTPTTSKMNICHYNESNGRWNAQQISTSAWATHQTHGDDELGVSDYEYGGPLAPNGHPAPHTGDQWCEDHQFDKGVTASLFGIKQALAQVEDETSTTEQIEVGEGQTVTCTIGNQFVEPNLLIAKSNNKELIDQSPGADVTYTLTVTAENNNVNGVTVIDLPPKGFTYRSGSWTAHSSVRGDLKPGITTEPTYASPGTWQLGNMVAGEVVTLTYIADISTDQKPGTYRDLALAQGTSTLDAEVVANDDTGTFVGTNVTVVRNTQLDTTVNVKREEKREVVGEVLGASTLPATGGDNAWTFASILLTLAGLLTFVLGFGMQKKRLSNVMGVIATIGMAFVITGNAYAITNTSIRLSQPKTPINQTFTLSFVALDLLDREIVVRCYKKGPTDGGYAQFGGDIAVIAGGNSGECPINDALLSQNGSYSFYATATATGDSAVTSPTISVDYNKDAPGTPTNYSKSKVGSCEYKISFRTANDTDTKKTVKVEIYRNENTSFAVDGSNKVGEVAIGPNEDGSFTNTVPDCGKTYYYVIRAFNSFGNGSGVIGDSEVTITTTTTSTTTTSSTTQGGALAVDNAGVAQGPQEEVTDEETNEPTDESAVLGETDDSTKGKGGVLGAVQDAVKKNKNAWVYILVIAVATLGLGYVVYKKTNGKDQE